MGRHRQIDSITELIQLRLRQGLGQKVIAQRLGVDIHRVTYILRQMKEKNEERGASTSEGSG